MCSWITLPKEHSLRSMPTSRCERTERLPNRRTDELTMRYGQQPPPGPVRLAYLCWLPSHQLASATGAAIGIRMRTDQRLNPRKVPSMWVVSTNSCQPRLRGRSKDQNSPASRLNGGSDSWRAATSVASCWRCTHDASSTATFAFSRDLVSFATTDQHMAHAEARRLKVSVLWPTVVAWTDFSRRYVSRWC